ncbi:DNA terminal protein [Bacillus phage VMY22]|uniref:Essential replication protein n=1 Tax=Bacillus phage VMY22 TaxID=1734382 RepID=A0A0N7GFF6_9CAUD|nr:DNA terminal protein [Bacillus phage VMY22]ALH46473.1 essential replication protein [Bacillus phage VMY22]
MTNDLTPPSLDSFKTRDEFNTWKEFASKLRYNPNFQFMKHEEGNKPVVVTKKRWNQLLKDTKDVQRKALAMIKSIEDIPVMKDKKQVMTKEAQMYMTSPESVSGINIPKTPVFKEIKSQRILEDRIESMRDRSRGDFYNERMEIFKENFIQKLKGSFNSDADLLVEAINQLSAREFYEMYQQYSYSYDFDLYDSDGQSDVADESHLGRMMEDYKEFMNTKDMNDLRVF